MSYWASMPLDLAIRFLPRKRTFFWREGYGDKIIIVSPSADNVSRDFRIESINASPCVYESEPLHLKVSQGVYLGSIESTYEACDRETKAI